MKVQKMILEYERWIKKCRNYRKAIRDQQKATLVWKARALEAQAKLKGVDTGKSELKAVG